MAALWLACAIVSPLHAHAAASPGTTPPLPTQASGADIGELDPGVLEVSEDADAHRRLAEELHQEGRLQDAIQAYRNGIEVSPGNLDLYLGLGRVYRSANLWVEAEALLSSVVDAFPDAVAARVDLAEVRFSAGKVEAALADFGAALETAGTNGPGDRAYILRRIGEMHVHRIRFDDALEAYRDALELAPGSVEIHMALGRLHLLRDRLEDALAAYREVLGQDSSSVFAYEGIAEAYLRLGDFDESIEASEAAIGIDPAHLRSQYLRATALIRAGRAEEAAPALDRFRRLEAAARARDHRDREVGGIYKEALAQSLRGNGAEAVRLLRRGLEAHPDARELHMNLGLTLKSLERHAEAVEVFEAMIDRGWDDEAVLRSWTEARDEKGRAGQ